MSAVTRLTSSLGALYDEGESKLVKEEEGESKLVKEEPAHKPTHIPPIAGVRLFEGRVFSPEIVRCIFRLLPSFTDLQKAAEKRTLSEFIANTSYNADRMLDPDAVAKIEGYLLPDLAHKSRALFSKQRTFLAKCEQILQAFRVDENGDVIGTTPKKREYRLPFGYPELIGAMQKFTQIIFATEDLKVLADGITFRIADSIFACVLSEDQNLHVFGALTKINEGSFGRIYKAYHLSLHRWCSIKFAVPYSREGKLQEVYDSIDNEYLTLESLHHTIKDASSWIQAPPFLRIHSKNWDTGRMEYGFMTKVVYACSLRTWLSRKDLTNSDRIEACIKVIGLYLKAKAASLIISDCKPDNFLLLLKGKNIKKIVFSDVGSSQFDHQKQHSFEHGTHTMGYASPVDMHRMKRARVARNGTLFVEAAWQNLAFTVAVTCYRVLAKGKYPYECIRGQHLSILSRFNKKGLAEYDSLLGSCFAESLAFEPSKRVPLTTLLKILEVSHKKMLASPSPSPSSSSSSSSTRSS